MPPWLVWNPNTYSADGGEFREKEILWAEDLTDLLFTSYLEPLLQYGIMFVLTS